MDDDDMLLTAKQAASRFGVTKETVVRWIKAGHLRGRKRGPGRTSGWLVPESEVRRLEAQLAGNTQPEKAGEEDES